MVITMNSAGVNLGCNILAVSFEGCALQIIFTGAK